MLLLGIAYLAVTLLMMQSMVNLLAIGSAVYSGDTFLIVWTLGWANHAVIDGVSLFDANIFYPAAGSLQYNEHLVGLSLFTLPVYALTRNPILGYNLIWLLAFVLNALATHALTVRHTRSQAAGVTAALIFTFSFYKILHAHGHLAHIWTWPIPLSVLLLERWFEKAAIGRALTWGAVVVLQALGSWYVALTIVLINGIVIAWWSAMRVRDQWGLRLRQLLIVTVGGAAIVAPFAMKYSTLEPPSLAELTQYSVDWKAYLTPPADTVVGRWWLSHIGAGPDWIWGERTVFLGWIASALAVAGALSLIWRREWLRAGLGLSLTLLGVLLSFGPSVTAGVEGPSLFGWLRLIPGIPGLRAPARFALVALFGVTLLAAEGARILFARAGRRATLVAMLLWPVMLVEWFVPVMPGGRPMRAEIPEIYRTDVLRNARAIVSLPDYGRSTEWYRGGDYLLYSTLYWRPIVNGFGRTEPPDYGHVISYMNAFPGPNNARKMRELGVEFLVLHGARYPGGVDEVVRVAMETGEYDLVRQVGSDYLFRVLQPR
jgi:hypothetical protein